MLDFLPDLLTTVFAGGAAGIVGTLISTVTKFLDRRQRHRMEMERMQLDKELMMLEGEQAAQIARAQGEAGALIASYEEAGTRFSQPGEGWLMQIVDVVRGLTRPGLTGLLVAAEVWLAWLIWQQVGTLVLEAKGPDMLGKIVDSVIYLATMCVTWWFGGRQLDRKG